MLSGRGCLATIRWIPSSLHRSDLPCHGRGLAGLAFAAASRCAPGPGHSADAAFDVEWAVDEVTNEVMGSLGEPPSFACFFSSLIPRASLEPLPQKFRKAFGSQTVIVGGVSDAGLYTVPQGLPAISMLAARLPPETQVIPFATLDPVLPELPPGCPTWADLVTCVAEDAAAVRSMLVFTSGAFDPSNLVRQLDVALPWTPKVGGILEGPLFAGGGGLEDAWRGTGGIGLLLHGGRMDVDILVSQGACPVGPTFSITRCTESKIVELDGQHVVDIVRSAIGPGEDQIRAGGALFIGMVVDGDAADTRPWHSISPGLSRFLVRHALSLSVDGLELAVPNDLLYPGMVVQLHRYGADEARSDLCKQLAQYTSTNLQNAAGALAVSCAGRGIHLFDEQCAELDMLRTYLGSDLSVSGFYAGGEIGPVGARTYVHGYTTSLALWRGGGSEQ